MEATLEQSGAAPPAPQEARFAAQSVPLTFPTIAIVNHPDSGEQDSDVWNWIKQGLAPQLVEDFGPIWHTGAHLRFVPSTQNPPAGVWVIAILANSDVAGALGYHDLTPDGYPLGKVGAQTDRQNGSSVSVTLDHELLEMLSDPWISLSAQDDLGRFIAWENCDAVEADNLGYQKNGVDLSAFVGPPWFGRGYGPLCFPEGRVSKPLELAAGGYISVLNPADGKGWQQTQARFAGSDLEVPAELAQQAYLARPARGSRRERRMAGPAAWVRSTYQTDGLR